MKMADREYSEWKNEAKLILPEYLLDQLDAQYPNDVLKQIGQAKQCVRENSEKIFWDASENHENKKEQIHYVVLWYLDERYAKLEGKQDSVFVTEPETPNMGDTEKFQFHSSNASEDNSVDDGDGNVSESLNNGSVCIEECVSASRICIPPYLRHYTERRVGYFQETEAYRETLAKIKPRVEKVVHVFGTPGSGKSQIVRSLCRELDNGERLIWHVQCKEENVLKGQWKKLLLKMVQGFLISEQLSEQINEDLDVGNLKQFVEILMQLPFPVLLVIEDFSTADKPLVQDLVRKVLDVKYEHRKGDILQVLIATRQLQSVFIRMDLDALPRYITLQNYGFTQEEAIKFLKAERRLKDSEKEDLGNLAKALAYSPLRLTLAKAYCVSDNVSYKKYFSALGKNQEIINKEKEILAENQYLADNHGYNLIMKTMSSFSDTEKAVVKMMSFLVNEDIPDVLVGKFLQKLKQMSLGDEETNVNHLLSGLRDYSLMYTFYPVDGRGYGSGLICTHMDILYAVNLSMSPEEKRKMLVAVLHTMIGLVHKDNRVKQDNDLLYHLMSHSNRVIVMAHEILKVSFDIKQPKFNEFQIHIGLSWLHEVMGFINTQHRVIKDANFEKAIWFLWSLICCYSSETSVIRSEDQKNLLDYEVGKDPVKTAEEADKLIRKACGKIPVEFVEEHYCKFYPFTLRALKDIKSVLIGDEELDWDEMERELKEKGSLSDEQIKLLRKRKVLLTPQQLHKTFLHERIASILHSRGRQVLYLQNEVSKDEQKRYEWYTSLGLKIAELLAQVEPEIHSIDEFILVSNNKLPRSLQNRDNESDRDFLVRLKNAKEMAEKARNPPGRYYEHGIYIKLAGTPYTTMNAIKYSVKANTKIYKRREVATANPFDNANNECNELFELAKLHADFVMAGNCRVQAGKYYAATGNYDKAIEAFESAFAHEGKGINTQLEKLPNSYAWALWNFGNALHKGATSNSILRAKGRDCKERFDMRYELVIKQKISPNWRQELDHCKNELDHTSFGHDENFNNLNGFSTFDSEKPNKLNVL